MIKFSEAQQNGELIGEAMFDEMINLVVIAFNNPDVNKESVEENVSFDELTDLFTYISRQVTVVANAKAKQIPNAVTPAKI